MAEGGMRLGVDLGGTKIEIAALAPDGSIALRERVATPQGDYAGTLAAIEALVGAARRAPGCADAPLGFGVPGSVSLAGDAMRNSNSTVLNGKPLLADLRARFGERVRMANDANCFALSEASDGAGAGEAVVFGTILGTGVGGGIVVDGRVLAGRNGIAGEWGHNPLPWPRDDERPGPPCYCGKSGCIETFLSGPALEREYASRTRERLRADRIAARAAAGEVRAVEVLEVDYVDRLARALAHAINILDPDVVVLGGGLSNIDALYALVPDRLARYVFSEIVTTRIVRAAHGDSSGVRGAAWLWPLTVAAESKSTGT